MKSFSGTFLLVCARSLINRRGSQAYNSQIKLASCSGNLLATSATSWFGLGATIPAATCLDRRGAAGATKNAYDQILCTSVDHGLVAGAERANASVYLPPWSYPHSPP